MLDTRRSMPAVLDRHIEKEEDDAFGHRHYSQALRSLIEDEGHRPSFSIGLLGGWGIRIRPRHMSGCCHSRRSTMGPECVKTHAPF